MHSLCLPVDAVTDASLFWRTDLQHTAAGTPAARHYCHPGASDTEHSEGRTRVSHAPCNRARVLSHRTSTNASTGTSHQELLVPIQKPPALNSKNHPNTPRSHWKVTVSTRKPPRGNQNHPGASRSHPQAFENTCHSGFERASSPGKISTNIKKVPHHRVTMPPNDRGWRRDLPLFCAILCRFRGSPKTDATDIFATYVGTQALWGGLACCRPICGLFYVAGKKGGQWASQNACA